LDTLSKFLARREARTTLNFVQRHVSEGCWSLWRHYHFRCLAIPLDLATQAGRVLVQDPVRRDGALVPILDFPEYAQSPC
jgi:hypothetical protein